MPRTLSLIACVVLLGGAGCADLAGLDVAILPAPARLDINLVATVVSAIPDISDEDLVYGYQWRADGVLQQDLTSDTVPWGRTSPDEVWAVRVVPWEGSRWGAAATSEVLLPSSPDHDCDGFEGPAGDGSDCDDADSGAHPEAEEDDGNGTDDDCDGVVDEFTFTRIHSQIVQIGCSCHTVFNGPAQLANLGTYDAAYSQLVDVPAHQAPALDRVEPFDPEYSYVMHKLDGTHVEVGGHGDQMPPDVPGGLSDELKDGIRGWILSGAPKD